MTFLPRLPVEQSHWLYEGFHLLTSISRALFKNTYDLPHWDHNLRLPDKKRRRVKTLLAAQLAIHNQIVPISIAPLRLAQHPLMGKTSLLQRPLLRTIGDIRRGFNAHNGIDREKIFGQ